MASVIAVASIATGIVIWIWAARRFTRDRELRRAGHPGGVESAIAARKADRNLRRRSGGLL